MENAGPKQYTLGVDNIYWVVERPKSQTKTMHVDTYYWRVPHQHRPVNMHLLFLRAAHGSRWIGRIRSAGHDGWMDDHVHGRVQLRRGCDYGE